jgi:hypothetical protein
MSPDAERQLNNIMMASLVANYPPRTVDLSNPSVKEACTHFIPQSAKTNKASDNAKLSQLIEMLLRNFARNTEDPAVMKQLQQVVEHGKLREALQTGIKARRDKVTGDLRKRNKGMTEEETEAQAMLEESAKRLAIFVKMME